MIIFVSEYSLKLKQKLTNFKLFKYVKLPAECTDTYLSNVEFRIEVHTCSYFRALKSIGEMMYFFGKKKLINRLMFLRITFRWQVALPSESTNESLIKFLR